MSNSIDDVRNNGTNELSQEQIDSNTILELMEVLWRLMLESMNRDSTEIFNGFLKEVLDSLGPYNKEPLQSDAINCLFNRLIYQ